MFSIFNRIAPVFNAGIFVQVANFSRFIPKSRAKRLPLTTKRAGKGYYKGNGCRKEGIISSKGY